MQGSYDNLKLVMGRFVACLEKVIEFKIVTDSILSICVEVSSDSVYLPESFSSAIVSSFLSLSVFVVSS